MTDPTTSAPDPSHVYGDNTVAERGVNHTRPLGHRVNGSPEPFGSRVRRPAIRKRIGDFLIFLTSADRTRIGSVSERQRYITIGLLMLTTAAQGFYAASLFASIGLGKPFSQAIGYGVFFAIAVYLIDRSIIGYVAPFKLDENGQVTPPRKTSWVLGIRIVIAVAAAALMSEMVLLQFFAKDIQSQIQSDHLSQIQQDSGKIHSTYQERINALQAPISAAETAVNAREQDVAKAFTAANCQEFGCPGVTAGNGPGFQHAEEILTNAQQALGNAQGQLQAIRNANGPQIAALETQEQQATNAARPTITDADAVLSREEAFWQLTTRYGTVLAVRILLSLLILGIDLAPILTKLTGRTTMHDMAVQSSDYTEVEKDKARVSTVTNSYASRGILDRERHDIEMETALTEAQRHADVARARAEADADVKLYQIRLDANLLKRKHHERYMAMKPHGANAEAGASAEHGGHDPDLPQTADEQDHDLDVGTVPEAPDVPDVEPGPLSSGDLDEIADLIFNRDEPSGRLVLDDRWVLYGRLPEADSGGGGMVWQARDRLGGPEWLVVKTVPAGSVSMEATAFLQQLGIHHEQRAQGIVSDNIGQIIACGEDQGLSYIVYPLYRPGSLALYCQNAANQRTLRCCAQVISGILAGLIDASKEGLVHLDIKPSNIVLDGTQPRIIDWGLSRAWNANQTYTAVARGTPFFASPEQLLRPSPGWDTPLADLYSVGATFYWLIANEAPLWYDAGDEHDPVTYRSLLADGVRPQPVHELVIGVPRALSTLIDRWLSFDPADRVPPIAPCGATLQAARRELAALRANVPAAMSVGQVTGRRRRRRR